MDFVFGFPEDADKNNGILVFVDRFSKMYNLAAVNKSISVYGCARVFIDTVFRLHGLPHELGSDRDPWFHGDVLAIRVPIPRNTSDYVYF